MLPDRRVPLTSITIDLATLAALNDLPAYLAGHGLIDAAYARELAANSDWQIVITEARNIADELHITLDNTTTADTTADNDDEVRDASAVSDAGNDSDACEAGDQSQASDETCSGGGGENEADGESTGTETTESENTAAKTAETAQSENTAAETDDRVEENDGDAADDRVEENDGDAADDRVEENDGDAADDQGDQNDCDAAEDTAAASNDGCAASERDAAAATGGSIPVDHLTFHPLGRGRRRRGLNLPKPAAGAARAQTVPNDTGPYRGSYTLIAALEKAIAANPAVAQALYPDGHGGFIEPPAGALQYKPRAQLADLVRHRDRTCRFPGCDVPAASCELDHIIPYLHHDPARGGWTILTNLHCLCRYHHSLKTMGAWHTTTLAGAIEHWTSNSGSTAVTLPGNSVGATDLTGHTLTPHIPRKRRPTCEKTSHEPKSTAPPPVEPDKTSETEKTSQAEKASETTTHDEPTDPWNVDITGKERVDADDPAPF
ncbi:hypothetical protein HQ343_25060 [Rhodococcus sp. BP-154]|uniref:HNH endonuclease signature motif containing protein n=1 Tax=Rhodococcus sp. BP-154 TaxID=2739476 RepID=UPI001C9B331E|nr:HNH endonuclease signature motif containing protein [Rhodococcus sp. BP-154]MBY6569846.1 hypothetical protein [Rhodococcus sp. BP-154]